jgi:gliding motility-associated-like protein
VVTNQTVSICPGRSFDINGHSYTTAGVYADTFYIPGTCDSIVNTTVLILPTSSHSTSATICSNQSYLFNGVSRNISGTYLDTFVNYVGCDSVESLILTVNLTSIGTINASICPGSTYLFNGVNRSVTGSYLDTFTNIIGCDSVVTLNLTLLATSTGSITTSICPGGSYLFNGINRTSAGTYLDTFVNSVGCDSVVTLNLSMRATSAGSFTIRICPGGSYLFNGISQTVAGSYLDTLVNSVGCDSVVTLNLVMLSTSTGSIAASICSGTSYLFNGINRFTAGLYLDTFVNSVGCDSVVTLTLTIRPTSTGSISASICPGSVYLFNGINRTTAGAYLDTFPNYLGCDSIVTLNLSIRPTSSRSFSVSICPGSSYLYNGVNRSVTGAYLDTFTNYVGCDSVVTLNLFVYLPVTRTQNITICNPSTITVGSNIYSTSGTFRDTFVNYVSCDSVVITNLTVNYVVNVLLQPIICEGYSFRVGSSIYTTTNIYMDTLTSYVGCDSIIQTNLTVNPRTYGAQSFTLCLGQSVRVGRNVYNTDGLYTDTLINVYGCDSVLTTDIIVKRPVIFVIDTSICIGNVYDGISYSVETHYIDTIVSSIGCDSFITQTNIYIIPDPALVASNDVTICAGYVTTLTAFGGNNVYDWTPSSYLTCSNCSNPDASPPTNTLYTVTSRGCNGNILTEDVFVTVQPLPLVNVLSMDTCVFYGQKVELIAEYDTTPTNHINWYVSGITVCTDCPVQIINPYLSGYYQAIVTDSVGCTASDSFDLCVRTDCPDSTLLVPNYMTPNGDGVNDNFTILNPENIPIVFLRIFDRWGTMIYESYSQTPSWNGYYLGSVALPGVYVYYIESTCPITGNIIKAGNITILE